MVAPDPRKPDPTPSEDTKLEPITSTKVSDPNEHDTDSSDRFEDSDLDEKDLVGQNLQADSEVDGQTKSEHKKQIEDLFDRMKQEFPQVEWETDDSDDGFDTDDTHDKKATGNSTPDGTTAGIDAAGDTTFDTVPLPVVKADDAPAGSTSSGTATTPGAKAADVPAGGTAPDASTPRARSPVVPDASFDFSLMVAPPAAAPDGTKTDATKAGATKTGPIETFTDDRLFELAPKKTDPSTDKLIPPPVEDLAQFLRHPKFRDGYSETIERTSKAVARMAPDSIERKSAMRDLTEAYQHPKTYSEKLAAAKALIELSRQKDGKIPAVIIDRDAVLKQEGHTVTSGSRGPQTRTYVMDKRAHHALVSLTSREVLDFINLSAESLETKTADLIEREGKANDLPYKTERDIHEQKLIEIFQTRSDDSPEKLAAANGLMQLRQGPDGKLPEHLGELVIHHQEKKGPVINGKPQILEAAYTERKPLAGKTVTDYLATRAGGLLDNALKVSDPNSEATPDVKLKQGTQAANVFLDSKNKVDKVGAAVSLLELNHETSSEILATRKVNVAAETVNVPETYTGSGKGKHRATAAYVKTIREAYVRTDAVGRDDVTAFLSKATKKDFPAEARLIAADSLKSRDLISDQDYRNVLEGIVSDPKADSSIVSNVRDRLKLAEAEEALIKQNNRFEAMEAPEDSIPLDTKSGDGLKFAESLLKLAKTDGIKENITDEQQKQLELEIANNQFGPVSRFVYNTGVGYLNVMTNELAAAHLSVGTLPEGCPIEAPRDANGKAVSDEEFRAEFFSGRLRFKLDPIEAGEKPNLTQFAKATTWDEKAASTLGEKMFTWEVADLDKAVSAFAGDGSMNKWRADSHPKMSEDQIKTFHALRSDWLQTAMQVRGYAHAIERFNRATARSDSRISISNIYLDYGKFSDKSLKRENGFPGDVVRDEFGRITSIRLDLPSTIEPTEANHKMMAKLHKWLEDNAKNVNQMSDEITKRSGQPLMWADMPSEGKDPTTGEDFNYVAYRFNTSKITLPNGETRIKVETSRQNRYATFASYHQIGYTTAAGPEVVSGAVTINGVPIEKSSDGIKIGDSGKLDTAFLGTSAVLLEAGMKRFEAKSTALIKLKANNEVAVISNPGLGSYGSDDVAEIKTNDQNQVFIRSKTGNVYIDGKPVHQKLTEVFPDQMDKITIGAPPAVVSILKNEKGEVAIDGKTLAANKSASIDSAGKINLDAKDSPANPDTVIQVDGSGRIYIKDHSKAGVYKNGEKISSNKWVEVSAEDKITMGPPAAKLDIKADTRLYREDDFVNMIMDGGVAQVQAKNLSGIKLDAAGWKYGSAGAMLLMDVAMIAESIASFGAATAPTLAAREAMVKMGEQAAKAAVRKLMLQGAKQLALGATGLAGQAIENLGPGGKTFMHVRGWVMAYDVIRHGPVAQFERLAGIAKADNAATLLDTYMFGSKVTDAAGAVRVLPGAPLAANLHRFGQTTFLCLTPYFFVEPTRSMLPILADRTWRRGDSSEQLAHEGTILRGDKVVQDAAPAAPPVTVLDKVLKFQDDRTRDAVNSALEETDIVAGFGSGDASDPLAHPELFSKLPWTGELAEAVKKARTSMAEKGITDAQKIEIKNELLETHRSSLINKFLDTKSNEEKIACSAALVQLKNSAPDGLPKDILGTRNKTADSLPEKVTVEDVRTFLTKFIPESINQADKEVLFAAQRLKQEVARIVSDPLKTSQLLIDKFKDTADPAMQLVAAQTLLSFRDASGAFPWASDVYKDQHGEKTGLAPDQVIQFVKDGNTRLVERNFDSYVATLKQPERSQLMEQLQTVRSDETKIPEELQKLQDRFNHESDLEKRGTAALGMLMLGTKGDTGAISRLPIAPKELIEFGQNNLTNFSPALRLAFADLLYRTGHPPLGGSDALTDLGGVFLSVLTDKNATREDKLRALSNSHSLDLVDVLEYQQFGIDKSLNSLSRKDADQIRASIYGRDSQAIKQALADLAKNDASGDVRAVAAEILHINRDSDPAKRMESKRTLEADLQAQRGTDNSFFESLVKRNLDLLSRKTEIKDPNVKEREFLQAALTMDSLRHDSTALTDRKLGEALTDSFKPMAASLALPALEPLLKHYDSLSASDQRRVQANILMTLIPVYDADGEQLRMAVLKKLPELVEKFGPGFAEKARTKVGDILIMENRDKYPENTRVQALNTIASIGSNDQKTRELLEHVLLGSDRDPSDVVRSKALDVLSKFIPIEINDIAKLLLHKETDAEITRKCWAEEKGSRRIDPDSRDYRELYQKALTNLLKSSNRFLTDAPEAMTRMFPLLNEHSLNTLAREKGTGSISGLGVGEGVLTGNLVDQMSKAYYKELEPARVEMNKQFDQLIASARNSKSADSFTSSTGNTDSKLSEHSRRILAWIVMSNGKNFSDVDRNAGVAKAAYGLYEVARHGDAEAKKAVAPLITMCLSTQDRMPPEARKALLNGLLWLEPGEKSAVKRDEAGIAILAALERTLNNTPTFGDSAKYASGRDPLPDISMAEEAMSVVTRDAKKFIKSVAYADGSYRTIDARDTDNRPTRETFHSKDVVKKNEVWEREGKGDVWYQDTDKEHLRPWRRPVPFDEATGSYKTYNQDYDSTHTLQLELLDSYAKFMGREGIPILEAMAEQSSKFRIVRGENGLIDYVRYPNGNELHVKYDELGNIAVRTEKVGNPPQSTTYIRKGKSDVWFNQANKDDIVYGDAQFDQENGQFTLTNRSNIKETVTAAGGRFFSNAEGVEKVLYPDGSRRELVPDGSSPTKYVYMRDKVSAETWLKESGSDTWYRDTDTERKYPWKGTIRFDSKTGDFIRRTENRVEVIDPDAGARYYVDGKVVSSKPGAGENVGHMPLVRDRAAHLLSELRDNTRTIRREAEEELNAASKNPAATQKLPDANQAASDLKAVLADSDANSEDVIKSVFKAGLVAPIKSDDDPRRETLRALLADPHERIRLAAARVLFASDIAIDRKDSATIIADMSVNGSREGYRNDASGFIQEVFNRKTALHDGDASLLNVAVDATPAQPRQHILSDREIADRSITYQMKFEHTKAKILRNEQRPLDRFNKIESWNDLGAPLLHPVNMETRYGEEFAHWFGDGFFARVGTVLKASVEAVRIILHGEEVEVPPELQAAVNQLKADRVGQFNSLVDKAKTDNGKDARDALAYIVMSNGFPLPQGLRTEYASKAAHALSDIYRSGGSGSAEISPMIEAALIDNPGLDRESRAILAHAVYLKSTDPKTAAELSSADAACILASALEAEQMTMPQPKHKEYAETKQFQSSLIKYLSELHEPIAMPVLNAVKDGHPDDAIRKKAGVVFDSLKDDTVSILDRTIPDLSGTKESRAKALDQILKIDPSSRKYDDEFIVGEMFRLAHPDHLTGKDDPAIDVLHTALSHSNERVRMAAVRIIQKVDPKDPQSLDCALHLFDATRGGIRGEAFNRINHSMLHKQIEDKDDPRREVLDRALRDPNEKVRFAAAWMLSHSNLEADYVRATYVLGDIAVGGKSAVDIKGVESTTSAWARGLLKDMIYHGGDQEQRVSLDAWNRSFAEQPSAPADRKPPEKPSEQEQARKYLRDNPWEMKRLTNLTDQQKEAVILSMNPGWTEQRLVSEFKTKPIARDGNTMYLMPFRQDSRFSQFNPLLTDQYDFGGRNRFGTRAGLPFSFEQVAPDPPVRIGPHLGPSRYDMLPSGAPSVQPSRYDMFRAPFQYDKVREAKPAEQSYDKFLEVPSLKASRKDRDSAQTDYLPWSDRRANEEWQEAVQKTKELTRGYGQLALGGDGSPESETLARAVWLAANSKSFENAHSKDFNLNVRVDDVRSLAVKFNDSGITDTTSGGVKLVRLEAATGGLLDFSALTPAPEFAEFVDYLYTQKRNLLEEPSLDATEFTLMYLQFLHDKKSGEIPALSLKLNSDGSNSYPLNLSGPAPTFATFNYNRNGTKYPTFAELKRNTEAETSENLNNLLEKSFASVEPESELPRWQQIRRREVERPDFMSRPRVEKLFVNQEAKELGIATLVPKDVTDRDGRVDTRALMKHYLKRDISTIPITRFLSETDRFGQVKLSDQAEALIKNLREARNVITLDYISSTNK